MNVNRLSPALRVLGGKDPDSARALGAAQGLPRGQGVRPGRAAVDGGQVRALHCTAVYRAVKDRP